MADNPTVDNGEEADFSVSTEQLSDNSHLQSVELHTESSGTKTKLAKAEDEQHASGDQGIMFLAVRKDTGPAALAGTDGDYIPLTTDDTGALYVNAGTLEAAAAITSVIPGTGATNLGKAEDAAHTSGDTGVMMLAVRQDSAAALAGTDGDYIPVTTDATGLLRVAVGSIPAADRTTDNIGAAHQTDAIMSDTTVLTPKFFSESVAASDTDEELVALVSAKKIRVLALAVQCGATATDVTFESSTTTRKHKVPAGANGGQILPFNPVGWFETAAGESLTCTTGTGSTVEISGCYVEV